MDIQKSKVMNLTIHIKSNLYPLQKHNKFTSFSQNEIPIETVKNFVLCSNNGGLVGVMNCALSRALETLNVASKTPHFEISPWITLEGYFFKYKIT